MDTMRAYDRTAALDVEAARIVGASRGWRYDGVTPRRPNRRAVGADDRTVAVQRLFERLDEDLGVRLPPREEQRLGRAPLNHPDTFTDAVLSADGLDPRVVPSLRGQVRRRVAQWLLALPVRR